MLVPGFIDTHVHFVTGGSGLASVQLRDAATPDRFQQRMPNSLPDWNRANGS
ncbi:MAG: hypothetical protein U5K38_02810 [Woeseiaceae bacterium]|nr:hypothetical protein [Woeseiaceae bacterium]